MSTRLSCLFTMLSTIVKKRATMFALLVVVSASVTSAFVPMQSPIRNELVSNGSRGSSSMQHLFGDNKSFSDCDNLIEKPGRWITNMAAAALVAASLTFSSPVFAENELSDKYGGGFDSSLVDQNCLVNQCSLQAKACLKDDPSCRKGLTCTAKCLGDNACITGCMARYGNDNLDNLLKCSIEDNECIKVAILDGGADKFGEEPRSPAPTIQNFNLNTLEGTWYKVAGYNPNYDCYACQRNSFHVPESSGMLAAKNDKLQVDVEFSMAHLMPDGSPPPPNKVRETIQKDLAGNIFGSQSIGLNDYSTHETMVFDNVKHVGPKFVTNAGTAKEVSYSRTAHSEGEMFGLKFWENWYVIGENDPGAQDFKFVYYNGKTRQNTYEGAFVYSRTKELSDESMKKVYMIAQDAGMNPDQFCKIYNGCFKDESPKDIGTQSNPFRGFIASTRVSQLLGVEPVSARDAIPVSARTAAVLTPEPQKVERAWWYEVGDYLENPHRHFKVMEKLRTPVVWPDDVKSQE